ncbi:hypothetical protein [Jiangella rhizosphaerae]|uniref:Alkaline shock response membrane anchor protein AmaP n=1 Tax=Jiangella rhizosphaerae TaxID=2293569 RepID=A0A418KVC7_9ACTN|nr:hypothetical protein [Jiangella rhizosphaerae]RIQ34738.1 hypothetical protein DY240_03595 [Jiangella rhizosphaerae]
MNRAAAGAERLAVLLTGLALLVLGAAAVAWERDWIPDAVDRLDASALLDRTGERWWPWAVGLLGLLLVVVGLLWLGAHARRRSLARLKLPGTGRGGALEVDSGALVEAASAALDEAPGVTARSGRVWRDQREVVAELRAALDPGADLDEVADAADRAAAVLGAYLGPQTAARCRVLLVRGRPWARRTRVR